MALAEEAVIGRRASKHSPQYLGKILDFWIFGFLAQTTRFPSLATRQPGVNCDTYPRSARSSRSHSHAKDPSHKTGQMQSGSRSTGQMRSGRSRSTGQMRSGRSRSEVASFNDPNRSLLIVSPNARVLTILFSVGFGHVGRCSILYQSRRIPAVCRAIPAIAAVGGP